ncbi:unnamed protein product [Pocillopora meandrina]|uniref:Guanylate-binding protein N-terminal domain-containing protein n=1 Tax=Pocillopora meandrina TaxID=46732 RepID=A0AAU9WSW1_9CNID|nr:unnamed protein product [Pocillopora meandrina]
MDLLRSFILSVHVIFNVCPGVYGGTAQLLLRINPDKKSYELNRGLLKIAELPAPIQITAVVGDERVGKSLTWNAWTGKNRSSEQVFQTGDSLTRVTQGVWAYVTQRENRSDILLEVEAADIGDDSFVAQIYMFAATISSGFIVLARDYVKDSDLETLNRMARLNEFAFPRTYCDNFPEVKFVVRGGPGGSEYSRSMRNSVLERLTPKYFPRSKITVSHISPVIDREVFKDFGKLSQSNFMTSMENLTAEVEGFPVKRNLEGIPMDGSEVTKLIERLAETISANNGFDFADIYNVIESNICKRSEKNLFGSLLELKSEHIELRKKNISIAFLKQCRLHSAFVSAKDNLERIILTKKSEDMKLILAEYKRKKVERDIEQIAKLEGDFQKIIAEKDRKTEEEREMRQRADQENQVLRMKIDAYMELLKEEMKRGGWLSALREVLTHDYPGGAQLLFDEIKNLREDIKRITEPEKTISIQKLSETFIKILSLCSTALTLALQIREIYRQPVPNQ